MCSEDIITKKRHIQLPTRYSHFSIMPQFPVRIVLKFRTSKTKLMLFPHTWSSNVLYLLIKQANHQGLTFDISLPIILEFSPPQILHTLNSSQIHIFPSISGAINYHPSPELQQQPPKLISLYPLTTQTQCFSHYVHIAARMVFLKPWIPTR